MIVGIKVLHGSRAPIGYGQSLGRALAMYLSAVLLGNSVVHRVRSKSRMARVGLSLLSLFVVGLELMRLLAVGGRTKATD